MEQIGFYHKVRQEPRLRNYSPKTIKSYPSSLRSFVAHFRPCHPRELTGSDIREGEVVSLRVEDIDASTGD